MPSTPARPGSWPDRTAGSRVSQDRRPCGSAGERPSPPSPSAAGGSWSAAARPSGRCAGRRSRRPRGRPGSGSRAGARPHRRRAPAGRCRRRSPSAARAGRAAATAPRRPPATWKSPARTQPGVEGDPGTLERRAVTVDARDRAEHVLGTADHPDPSVAERRSDAGRRRSRRPSWPIRSRRHRAPAHRPDRRRRS